MEQSNKNNGKEDIMTLEPKPTNSTAYNEIKLENNNEEPQLECPKYKKEDSLAGYLFNKDEIEDYKRKQKIDIMKNALLGDFDDEGNYYLSSKILEELKNSRKEIVEQYKTYLFLQTVFPVKGFGNIKFFVSVSKLASGELKARLVILEKVDKINGYLTNTISLQINEYIDNANPQYYNNMKKAFNIIKVDQQSQDDEEELKYCEIRKLQQIELWNASVKQIEKIEKNIFEKKIKMLSEMKNNEFAKALLDTFYKESAKINNIFIENSNEKYSALNTLLDECFNRMKGKMPIQEKIIETALLDIAKSAILLQEKVVNSVKAETVTKVEQNLNKIASQKNSSNQEKSKIEQNISKNSQVLPGANFGQISYNDELKIKKDANTEQQPIKDEIKNQEMEKTKSFENLAENYLDKSSLSENSVKQEKQEINLPLNKTQEKSPQLEIELNF